MPPLSLTDFNASDLDYVQKLNNNNTAIEAAVNALQAQVLASVGEGVDLILDTFDRDGLVGAHSYVLDLDNYPGGSQITIGRRPAPLFPGEVDKSIAWGTYSGEHFRVSMTGDLVLNAISIVSGLPKTIYVGIPSDGIPQLFESGAVPNVLYVYSMTWDGYSLKDFRRLAPILPHYSALQGIAGAPRFFTLFDSETDWTSEIVGSSEITLPGARDDNEIDVDGAVEILGFFMTAGKPGTDGFAATGSTPEHNKVGVKVVSAAEDYTETPFEFDASNVPDTIFRKINPALQDKRFVTEVQRFTLERTELGPFVISARAFSWGIIYRPIIGIPIPKDQGDVVLI